MAERLIPCWKVEVAPSSGETYLEGQGPLRAAVLFSTCRALTRPVGIDDAHHWPIYWECLGGYTNGVQTIYCDTVLPADTSKHSDATVQVVMTPYGQSSHHWRTVRPNGLPGTYFVEFCPWAAKAVPGDIDKRHDWAICTSSLPEGLGLTPGNSSLKVSPSFEILLFNYDPPDDARRQTSSADCGRCWGSQAHVPKNIRKETAHLTVEWGGCWQLSIFPPQPEEDQGASAATDAQMFLYRRYNGKLFLMNEGGMGWPVNLSSLGDTQRRVLRISVIELGPYLWIYFDHNPSTAHLIGPSQRVPIWDFEGPLTDYNLQDVIGDDRLWNTPAARMAVHGMYCPMQFSLSPLKFSLLGQVGIGYQIPSDAIDPTADDIYPIAYLSATDSTCIVNPTVVDYEDAPKYFYLQFDLHTGDDGESPILYGTILHKEGTRLTNEPQWVDFSGAVSSITEHVTEPAQVGITEVQITLDRALLDNLYPEWEDYLGQFYFVRLWLGWDNELALRFEGYIYDLPEDLRAWGDQSPTLVCRDALMLALRPAALVDFRYTALDCLAMMYGGDIPGYQAVRYLLANVWNEDWVNLLVLGDTIIWPDSHWNLVSGLPWRRGLSPRTGQLGFYWPPPWGQHLHDWLQEIAEYDICMLYLRPRQYTEGWQITPHYVDYNEFRQPKYSGHLWNEYQCYTRVSGSTSAGAPEAADEWELNHLIFRGRVDRRQAEAFNVVEVWAMLEGETFPLPNKSFYQEAPYLHDPTSPYYIPWQQVLMPEKEPAYVLEDIAQAVGVGLCRRFFYRAPVHFRFDTLGQPYWWWGDVIELMDETGPLPAGHRMRIVSMESRLDCKEALSYTTTVELCEEPAT